jgi:outer membrane immunogenic protein
MKKMSLIAACMALTTPVAFAQARFFEGFSLGANAEMQRSTVDVNATGLSDSGNGSGLGLQAQYSFALTNQFVLGVGASFSTGNRNAAAASGPLGADIYSKNNSAFELTPGYAVSDTVLVFGKISALSGTAQNDTLARSYSLSGMGYGLGLRSMIDKNLFFQIGYDWNKYNDVTDSAVPVTFMPKSTLFSLGMGYKF